MKLINLSKIKNSKFKIILVAIIILSLVGSYFIFFRSSAQAAWWDEDWLYRKPVTITNNTTAESNVYIQLDIGDTSNTDKFQADCGDVRFTKKNGMLLDYYIVSGCGTGSTTINVLFDTLEAGAQSMYIYYGNPTIENGFKAVDFTASEASNYSVGAVGAEEVGTGPSLWLRFDEGYGGTAFDSSGQGNNGTITSATWSDTGKFGKALSFDGTNDVVAVGDIGQSIKTVSMWVRPNSITSTTEYPLDLNGSAYVKIANGVVTGEGFTSPTVYVNGIAGASAEALKWNHIEITTETGIDASAIDVGEYGAVFFAGKIDEVKLYNTTRTSAQVKKDYNKGASARIGGDNSWMEDGLVGHWKMNEASWNTTPSQVIDSSGAGNHGTSAGNATTGAGKFGRGGTFDGSGDYVDVGDTSQTGVKSVSLWVKPDSIGITQEVLDLNGTAYVKLTSATVSGEGFTDPTVYINSVNANTATTGWNHIVITTNTGINASDMDIGRLESSTDFAGFIDNVMIYDYALTARQIAQLYADSGPSEAKSPVNSTVGHWKLDDGEGTVAEDSSGFGNDLTLSAVSWTNSGKFGGAWNGAGNNWITQGADDNDFDFIASDDFGISLWFKSDSADNPAANEFLINKATASAGYAIYMDTGGDVIFGIDDDTTWSPDATAGDIGADYYDNQWHHVVASKTGIARMDIYVDGVLINSNTSISAIGTLANSAHLIIGSQDATDDADDFNGDIDDVRIFRFAPAKDDVLMLYNEGKAVKMGAVSTESDGVTPSYGQDRAYCPPGFTGTCTPPIAHWKMDEGADGTCTGGVNDVCDTSANSNDGAINGNPVWKNAAQCKSGNCLSFDGDGDYVDLGSGLYAINDIKTSGITFSAWINPAAIVDSRRDQGIVGGAGGATHTHYSAGGIFFDSGSISSGVGVSIYDTTNGYTVVVVYNIPSANTWYHVVGVIDSTSNAVRLYLNSAEIGNDTFDASAMSFNPTYAYIGRMTNNDLFNGLIDDVMIYDRALTETEIAWLYNKGKPAGHWKFDEGQGVTAKDSTTNNKTGTLTGGPTWVAGKYNSGIDFAGDNDYVDIGATGLANVKAVSLWVKPDSITATTEYPLDLNGTAYVKITNGVVTGQGFISSTVYINGKSGASAVTAGEWSHIFIKTDTAISATDMDIGRLDANYYAGLIDEVKVYNYSPTDQQVLLDYNQGSAIRF